MYQVLIDIGIYVFILLFLIVLEIKNITTYKNFCIVIDAIHDYNLDSLISDSKNLVDYEDMISYDKALFKIWDWGHKHILPTDKYELITPYIKPYSGDKKKN